MDWKMAVINEAGIKSSTDRKLKAKGSSFDLRTICSWTPSQHRMCYTYFELKTLFAFFSNLSWSVNLPVILFYATEKVREMAKYCLQALQDKMTTILLSFWAWKQRRVPLDIFAVINIILLLRKHLPHCSMKGSNKYGKRIIETAVSNIKDKLQTD